MHVTGPASPLTPRNKDQSADAAKNHSLIFLNHCLEGCGNVPNLRNVADKVPVYRGGPHMRSLISLDFPAPEMEPESAHVVSAVSVP